MKEANLENFNLLLEKITLKESDEAYWRKSYIERYEASMQNLVSESADIC